MMRIMKWMGLRWCILVSPLALLIAMLFGAVAAAVAGEPEGVSSSPFGVVCPWPGMDQVGIKWCRVGAGATAFANWPEIQPGPDTWNWSRSDSELKDMLDPLGVSVLPILGYTPKWASRTPEDPSAHAYPPKDIATFARFVHQCVARYKGRVKVWEVWNEPNIGFLNGSVADYADMVKAASVAAKQADPECRIAMGCAGVDLDYLQRLYEFGCGPYFDVMAVHPYQWGKELNDDWMREKLRGCRDLMDRQGDADKEIWITEQGWSLTEGINAVEQANLLTQAMVTTLSVRERLKVEKYFWFSVKDWGGPGFGLFDVDGKPKPVCHAYQAVTTEMADARYRGVWKAPEGVRAHVFEQAGQPVLVLWIVSAAGKIPVEIATSADSLSIRGTDNQVFERKPVQGKATIDAAHAPVFVRGLAMSDLPVIAVPQTPTVEKSPRAPMMRDVWVSVVPPATAARPFAALGGASELPLEIHNDSPQQAQGTLRMELVYKDQMLAKGELAFDTSPGKTQSIAWQPTLAAQDAIAGELAVLRVRGNMGPTALAPIDLSVRLARGKVTEFTANSWPEHPYLYKAEGSGTADSIRFGGEFGYRFDLGNAKSGELRMNVGANGANPWNLLVSTDDKEYTSERSGKSWPSWQTVVLDKYLAGPRNGPAILYVKIQGTDCQLREVILQSDQH